LKILIIKILHLYLINRAFDFNNESFNLIYYGILFKVSTEVLVEI